ncbi:MAG: hypothetical protein ACOVN2_08975 [Usitatibacteraceae bacterium]
MSLITPLALVVVVLVGLYMLALGAASRCVPAPAGRFVRGVARPGLVHFVELFLRLLAGAALVLSAPNMYFSTAFLLFGWVLVITTASLLVVPWRWHRRFAQQAVPQAMRYIFLIGLASLCFGAFVLFAVARGNAA